MLSKVQARNLVAAELARPTNVRYPSDPTDLVIIEENTIERDWGWVFFYNSERYLKTEDIRDALAGNAPYIVNRHTGELRTTGTVHPIENYIADYERELTHAGGPEKMRQFQAIIWNKDPNRPGQRVTVFATNLDDARNRLEHDHGEGSVFDLHNSDDAAVQR